MELKFEGKRKYSLCDFSLNKTGLKAIGKKTKARSTAKRTLG